MIVARYQYADQFENIEQVLSCFREMLLNGHYVLSPEVAAFESAFARYCGCAFTRGVNSGTDALIIAMRAIGIGAGDEVITQANTFHATVAAIELAGATPILVDAMEDSFLMDVRQLASAITTRTRAIIPVHLYGKPTPMGEILRLAAVHGLFVIEDAAQAHGASFLGGRAGSFGTCGCFSFHPSKNLAAAGDAGAVVTGDETLCRRIDVFRALGQRGQNEHIAVGLNSKMDALQACVLQHKLPHLDAWNQQRAEVAEWYRQELGGTPLAFQSQGPGEVHVYHLLQVRTPYRDDLLSYLKDEGVDVVVRYPTPIHLQPAFQKYQWRRGEFPISEMLARELLALPIRAGMKRSEIGYVGDRVKKFFSKQGQRGLVGVSSELV